MTTADSRRSAAEAALVASDVSKAFANGVVALDGIDLRVGRGGISALVGENGSGKSTLLELFAGVLDPSSGTLEVLGERSGDRAAALRRRVGFVSQTPELDPEMTGAETLQFFRALYGVRASAEHEELLRAFGLVDYLERPVGSYSGGMRQRLHLAIGFVHRPELLLLDEPTAALDPAGQSWFWSHLEAERERGRTVLIVTHDLVETARRADQLVLLHRGRLLANASPARVLLDHSSFQLELSFSEAGGGKAVADALGALSGVKSATSRQGRMLVELDSSEEREAHVVKQRVLEALTRSGIAVAAFRLSPPDLASAYFNLTGHSLLPARSRRPGSRASARAERASAP